VFVLLNRSVNLLLSIYHACDLAPHLFGFCGSFRARLSELAPLGPPLKEQRWSVEHAIEEL